MHRIIYILTGLLLYCGALNAQQKNYIYTDSTLEETTEEVSENGVTVAPPAIDDSNQSIEVDTTLYYNDLIISRDTVNAWKNLKTFSYVKSLDSLLKLKKEEGTEKTTVRKQPYPSSSGSTWLGDALSSSLLQVILWILAGGFVLFILYKLFLTEGMFQKNVKVTRASTPEAEEEVITAESDFERLIREAIKSGNYRLAVRYQYLHTLHKLSDKNLIQLAADKTNYQYVREIGNQNFQTDFAALTLNYEYVWYGEFAIDEVTYKKVETSFMQFNTKIS
jgi:hypothetical protein